MSSNAGSVDRRKFLQLATGAVAATAAGFAVQPVLAAPGGVPGPPGGGGGGGGGGTSTRNPIFRPSQVHPDGLSLTAAATTVDLGGGQLGHGVGYNASIPGPTLRANQGDQADVTLTNGLEDPTTIHWHGMIVPSNMDGHPMDGCGDAWRDIPVHVSFGSAGHHELVSPSSTR